LLPKPVPQTADGSPELENWFPALALEDSGEGIVPRAHTRAWPASCGIIGPYPAIAKALLTLKILLNFLCHGVR
jgi:hypothetical protein